MGTKKFRLLAVFLEATMLAVEDSQVEFEMSIGKHAQQKLFMSRSHMAHIP